MWKARRMGQEMMEIPWLEIRQVGAASARGLLHFPGWDVGRSRPRLLDKQMGCLVWRTCA